MRKIVCVIRHVTMGMVVTSSVLSMEHVTSTTNVTVTLCQDGKELGVNSRHALYILSPWPFAVTMVIATVSHTHVNVSRDGGVQHVMNLTVRVNLTALNVASVMVNIRVDQGVLIVLVTGWG